MSACTASHKTPFFQVAQVKHSGHNRAFVLNCFLLPISYVFKRETSRLLQILNIGPADLRENQRIWFSTFIPVHKCTTRWSISKSQEMSWLVYRPKSPPLHFVLVQESGNIGHTENVQGSHRHVHALSTITTCLYQAGPCWVSHVIHPLPLPFHPFCSRAELQ